MRLCRDDYRKDVIIKKELFDTEIKTDLFSGELREFLTSIS